LKPVIKTITTTRNGTIPDVTKPVEKTNSKITTNSTPNVTIVELYTNMAKDISTDVQAKNIRIPEVIKHNVTTPIIKTRNVTTEDVTPQNIIKPDVIRHDVITTNVTTHNLTIPDDIKHTDIPKIILPTRNITIPDLTTRNVTIPHTINSNVTTPNVTAHNVKISEVIKSYVTTNIITGVGIDVRKNVTTDVVLHQAANVPTGLIMNMTSGQSTQIVAPDVIPPNATNVLTVERINNAVNVTPNVTEITASLTPTKVQMGPQANITNAGQRSVNKPTPKSDTKTSATVITSSDTLVVVPEVVPPSKSTFSTKSVATVTAPTTITVTPSNTTTSAIQTTTTHTTASTTPPTIPPAIPFATPSTTPSTTIVTTRTTSTPASLPTTINKHAIKPFTLDQPQSISQSKYEIDKSNIRPLPVQSPSNSITTAISKPKFSKNLPGRKLANLVTNSSTTIVQSSRPKMPLKQPETNIETVGRNSTGSSKLPNQNIDSYVVPTGKKSHFNPHIQSSDCENNSNILYGAKTLLLFLLFI